MIPSDINQEALDLMTDFGGESLAGAAKIFMIEANKHGFSHFVLEILRDAL